MSDALSVAATTSPITLADAKRHLNVSSTADDTLIQDYVNGAAVMLETRGSRAFIDQTRVLKMQTFSDSRYMRNRKITLPRSPLSSVTSITYIDSAGTTQTLSSTSYRTSLADEPGRIAEAYNNTWPATQNIQDDVTVTYVAGHSSASSGVSDPAKQAVRMVVGHWYRNRESVTVGTINNEIAMGVDALMEGEQIEGYA